MCSRKLTALLMPLAAGLLCGCPLLDTGPDDPFAAGAGPGGMYASGTGRARWIHVRVWTEAAPPDGADHAPDRPVKIEATGARVGAAGLRVSAVARPDGEYATALIRKSQGAFAAIARDEECLPLEIAGRPLGGKGRPLDVGFEVGVELLPAGELSLELAPLFRAPGAPRSDETRAHAYGFRVTVPNGAVLCIEGRPGVSDPVLRALMFDASGRPRRLWLQAEAFR